MNGQWTTGQDSEIVNKLKRTDGVKPNIDNVYLIQSACTMTGAGSQISRKTDNNC